MSELRFVSLLPSDLCRRRGSPWVPLTLWKNSCYFTGVPPQPPPLWSHCNRFLFTPLLRIWANWSTTYSLTFPSSKIAHSLSRLSYWHHVTTEVIRKTSLGSWWKSSYANAVVWPSTHKRLFKYRCIVLASEPGHPGDIYWTDITATLHTYRNKGSTLCIRYLPRLN